MYQFNKDEHYNVTITSVLDRGCIVTISGVDGQTGFIHISQIADCYVNRVSDFVSVGETYDAVCTDTMRPGFSLVHLKLKQKTVPEFYKRATAAKSLDDMIARADASLKDKQRSRHVQTTRQKRHRGTKKSDDMDFDF